MQILKNKSVKSQLVLLTLVSSSAGLLLAFFLFTLHDEHLLRDHKVEELQSAADLIARNSAAALIFDDGSEAERILRALEMRVHIREGCCIEPMGACWRHMLGQDRRRRPTMCQPRRKRQCGGRRMAWNCGTREPGMGTSSGHFISRPRRKT
jgi:hypothetical protein